MCRPLAVIHLAGVLLAYLHVCSGCTKLGYYTTDGVTCIACTPGSASSTYGATVCDLCSRGRYATQSVARICNDCASGLYASTLGQTSCQICPGGTYSQRATVSSTCFLCTPGYFSLQQVSVCSICSAGYYSTQAGAAACMGCIPGTYSNTTGQTVCKNCTLGQYSIGQNASTGCAACPIGTYANVSWSSTACSMCRAGFFNNLYAQTLCLACSAGFYGTNMSMSVCTACGLGTYAASTASTACKLCEVGNYTNLASAASICAACSNGTYAESNVGATVCSKCAPGTYVKNKLFCSDCLQGTYSSMSTTSACLLCDRGYFAGNIKASQCQACGAGEYIMSRGGSICSACPSGTAPKVLTAASFCYKCDAGSFSNVYGSTACTLCASGFFTSQTGVTACVECPGVPPLPPPGATTCTMTFQCVPMAGYYGMPSQTCPYDTYCPKGSMVPIPCPQNVSFAPMGSWSILNCTAFMMSPCRSGYYYDSIQGKCQKCMAGCYCPGTDAIIACDAAVNYTSPPGATSILQCIPGDQQMPLLQGVCPDNTQPGLGVVTLQSRLQCRANAGYYYVPGALAVSAIPCPASFYCPVGSVVPTPCPPPPVACPEMGQFPTPNSLCPLSGAVQPAAACQTCVGLPSNAYWTSNSDPTCPACCQANYYRYTASACNLQPDSSVCGAGEYMPTPLPCAMSVQSCTACPALSSALGFDFVNASARSVQGYGIASGCSQTACAAGYRLLASNGICLACPPGTFKGWVGNDTTCAPCGDGQIANAATSATNCTRCPAFSLAWQGVECRCLIGFYLSAASGGACVACAPGFVTTNGTQTACTQCAAGTKWTPY